MTQKMDDSNMNMIRTMKMQNCDNCVTVSWEDRKVGVSSKADLWTIVGKKSFVQIDTEKRDLEKSIINKNLKQKKKKPIYNSKHHSLHSKHGQSVELRKHINVLNDIRINFGVGRDFGSSLRQHLVVLFTLG